MSDLHRDRHFLVHKTERLGMAVTSSGYLVSQTHCLPFPDITCPSFSKLMLRRQDIHEQILDIVLTPENHRGKSL